MVVLTVFVFGLLSLDLLPVNLLPPITYPSITVQAEYPGAAPEEVEEVVTRPLEQSLGVLRDLVDMRSSSRAELSEITLEFDWKADMDRATQETREKIDLVFLPDDVRPPVILRYDPNLDPIIRLALTGPNDSSQKVAPRELRRLAEDLVKRELEKVSGVAAVRVKGGEEVVYQVRVDAAKMALLSITPEEIASRLASDNVNVAGGRIADGSAEYMLRARLEFTGVDDIGGTHIASRQGQQIYLREIAGVHRESQDPLTITEVDGRTSVELEVFREGEANPTIVSEGVLKRLYGQSDKQDDFAAKSGAANEPGRFHIPTIVEMLPAGVECLVVSDQARFIRLAIDDVRSAAVVGGLLAVLVLLFFLGKILPTLVVAISIPISLVAAFAAMHMSGVTLNIMSLGGLALGVGMMVDNAVVVVESISRRKESGDTGVEAAVRGTQLVGGAVTASTLTTLVVFFPIVFVSGVAGQLFGDMSLTIVLALSMSLAVALLYVPMLTTRSKKRLLRKQAINKEDSYVAQDLRKLIPIRSEWVKARDDWRSIANIDAPLLRYPALGVAAIYLLLRAILGILTGFLRLAGHWMVVIILFLTSWIQRKRAGKPVAADPSRREQFQIALESSYLKLLEYLLRRPLRILLPVVIVILPVAFFLLPYLGSDLVPTFSQGLFDVQMELPVGTPLEKTHSVARRIAGQIVGDNAAERVSVRSGNDRGEGSRVASDAHRADITVDLKPGSSLARRQSRLIEQIRNSARDIPGLELRVKTPTLFTFKQPVEIAVLEDDPERLRSRCSVIIDALRGDSAFVDLETTVRSGHPEANVRFDRDRLARLGLSARFVADRLRGLVYGDVPTRVREADRRVDIRVRLDQFIPPSGTGASASFFDEGLRTLREVVVNPGQERPVKLADIASIDIREGPVEIVHLDGVRAGIVTADLRSTDIRSATSRARERLERTGLQVGQDYRFRGQSREMEASLGSLKRALLLALFFVYVVMASQFESFGRPLIILATVPVALSAVIPALFLLNLPLSVMVFLGLIVLVGVVVNNSIILVDAIHKMQGSSQGIRDGMPTSNLEPILEAARLRLRPILMTTLTTIIGLLPMAIGFGEGAELRRPLAITVVVGLSFGLLVSLFFVPVLYHLTRRKQV